MRKCELCKNKASEIWDCLSCGSTYCQECGDVNRNLCESCISYEEDSIGSEED